MLANAYPPVYMGGESIHLYNLVTGLKKRGHRLFVVHAVPTGDSMACVKLSRPEPRIDVYCIYLREKDGYIDTLNHILMDIFRNVLRYGVHIDLIHCHSNRFSWAVRELARKSSIPVITTIHAIHIPMVHEVSRIKKVAIDAADRVLYHEDTRRTIGLCAKSDRIIGISQAMVSLIVRYYGPDTQKMRLVYNGIDVDRLTNHSDYESVSRIKEKLAIGDKQVILFAGRIEPIKGIKPFASAAREMSSSHKDIAFLFLGNGSADKWLRSYLSGSKNVHFIDWLPFEGIIAFYHLADIVVVPSLIEPFGLVAVEAMACRTCVIASNADGLDEIITHDFNGIKIPLVLDEEGDRNIKTEDIHKSLEGALLDPEKRQSLAEQGVVRAWDFTRDRMAKEVEKVYLSL